LRTLISGGTGFVGPYLCRHLLEHGDEVAVISVNRGSLPGSVAFFQEDIRDPTAVQRVFNEVRPEAVYHLAAISTIGAARKNLRLLFEINVGGTYNLFEAASNLASPLRILNVSSAQVYGGGAGCLDENSRIAPANPYAASKAMAELVATQFGDVANIDCITVRPFNHSGPGQGPDFVLSSFARQVAEIEAGIKSPLLLVGDLEVERDFLDVRDVVRAYRLLIERGSRGAVYNLGTGDAHSIEAILGTFRSLSRVAFDVKVDPERVRPKQPRRICGSSAKLIADTGWHPVVPLQDTLRDLLKYWRAWLGNSPAHTATPRS
jgi:GDP-4-dehydro-6-deoxy-D-mannose reductase